MNDLRFVRHAATDMAGAFCGQADPPLNTLGHQQVAALLHRLQPGAHDAVYTSDLQRAHTTAAALASAFAIPCIKRPALREIRFGLWEGLTWNEIEAQDRDYAVRWLKEFPYLGTPGGESFADFETRVREEVDYLLHQGDHQRILVVTHAGVLRSVLKARSKCDDQQAWELTHDYCCTFRYVDQNVQGAI